MATILVGAFGAVVSAIIVIVLAAEIRGERRLSARLRIRLEEAQAWADEYQRERDQLAAECERLRIINHTLARGQQQLTDTDVIRQALADNFYLIARNVARRASLG